MVLMTDVARKLWSLLLIAPFFAASGAPACAQAEKATVIHLKIDEKHDRLTPEEDDDIEWMHDFTVTLSGKNQISESAKNTFLGSVLHPYPKRSLTTEFQHSVAFGENDGHVVWHVLSPQKLQRIFAGKQFLSIFDIEISGANCRIQAKYLLQTGYTEIIMKRAKTGTLEHFRLPHVVSATCSIGDS